ncbi:MAG: replicative DNA helicase [bacterium]
MADQPPVLPHNLTAERSVLGAMIRDQSAILSAQEIIAPDDFYSAAHQKLFDTLAELNAAGKGVDLTMIAESLDRQGQLREVGGPVYLAELIDTVSTSVNVAHHAGIVKELSLRRRLIRSCTDIIGRAQKGPEEVRSLLSWAEESLFNLSRARVTRSFLPLGELLGETVRKVDLAFERQGGLTGLSSGFRDLDNFTAGFQKSDLIILAARPSVGKTSLVMNIAEYAARNGRPVGIFSLEMSCEQLAERILCSQARINLQKLRAGQINRREAGKLLAMADELHDLPIFIDDTPNLTPTDVFTRARRLQAEYSDLALIVVDYIQLMTSHRVKDNRQQEVADISRSLKALARELEVPVIACSQLSRAVEQRNDKPRLSDLRESGAIEQDADVVMFLHRQAQRGDGNGSDIPSDGPHQLQYDYSIIIGKHRNGPVGELGIYFIREYTRFEDLSPRDNSDIPPPGVLDQPDRDSVILLPTENIDDVPF